MADSAYIIFWKNYHLSMTA